ncbi:MAG: ABC transporter substrate-binding protein [Micromonosporaceae bacterium]
MKRRTLALAVALALTGALAGCGGGEPAAEPSTPAGDDYPVTVEGAAGKVVLDKQPTKIVSLSPTATEMLFAIGAGKQVAAVDDLSNYPKDAPVTKLSGFKPNADAVAGYDPDLVVLAYDANQVVDSLKKLKIPVYVAPAATTLQDTYQQIEDLGALTGRAKEAQALNERMKADIAKLTKDVPKRDKPLTYYYELDPQLHSATSKTFIGAVLKEAGLQNIADAADKDGSGYPQLSAEYVISANPDLVFLADTKCCGQSPEVVAKRPGWNKLTAVKSGGVYALDDDIASRWGPRIVELVRIVTDAAAKVPA